MTSIVERGARQVETGVYRSRSKYYVFIVIKYRLVSKNSTADRAIAMTSVSHFNHVENQNEAEKNYHIRHELIATEKITIFCEHVYIDIRVNKSLNVYNIL